MDQTTLPTKTSRLLEAGFDGTVSKVVRNGSQKPNRHLFQKVPITLAILRSLLILNNINTYSTVIKRK